MTDHIDWFTALPEFTGSGGIAHMPDRCKISYASYFERKSGLDYTESEAPYFKNPEGWYLEELRDYGDRSFFGLGEANPKAYRLIYLKDDVTGPDDPTPNRLVIRVVDEWSYIVTRASRYVKDVYDVDEVIHIDVVDGKPLAPIDIDFDKVPFEPRCWLTPSKRARFQILTSRPSGAIALSPAYAAHDVSMISSKASVGMSLAVICKATHEVRTAVQMIDIPDIVTNVRFMWGAGDYEKYGIDNVVRYDLSSGPRLRMRDLTEAMVKEAVATWHENKA